MPSSTVPASCSPLANIQRPQKPAIAHVNMQLDSFLANTNIDDLRAIVRTLLATGPAGTTATFTKIARNRVQNTAHRRLPSPSSFFTVEPSTSLSLPTQALWDTLHRARTLFGVGLGFQSIPLLITIVDASVGHRWEEESPMEDALITVDADLAQCLQSCREQLTANEVPDRELAKRLLGQLGESLKKAEEAIEGWGGEFPMEKGQMALEGWKL